MSTPTNAELLDNVVQLLCAAEALWPSGCCVLSLTTGQTAEQLQTELEVSFPMNGWDDLAQLPAILEYGRRRGVLQRYCDPDSGATLYFLFLDMVRLNPLNEQYRATCPVIYQLPTMPCFESVV